MIHFLKRYAAALALTVIICSVVSVGNAANSQRFAQTAEALTPSKARNHEFTKMYDVPIETPLLPDKLREAFEACIHTAAITRIETAEDTPIIDEICLTRCPSFGITGEIQETMSILVPDEALIALLYKHHFFNMQEYLDTGVLDGDFTWITVHFNNGVTKRVGGLMAEVAGAAGFIAVYDAVVIALNNFQE